MGQNIILIVSLFIVMASCKGMKESSKYQFNEGTYKVRLADHRGKAYVVVTDDSVKVYPLNKPVFDSTEFIQLTFPSKTANAAQGRNVFVANSFDLDVLTILFKYRPSVKGFPNQFTTHFNGAVYLGYRSDVFKIAYQKTPLYYKRRIEHYGYSFGGFAGIGATAMNPWVTQNNITDEYDGFVISKGLALHIAVNAFTFGVAVGWDHLTDRNKRYWIYQGKSWVGITLGLNLN